MNEINEMNSEELEARTEAIKAEVLDETITEERSNELNAELDLIESRKAELIANAEAREAEAKEIENGAGQVTESIEIMEERKMDRSTVEYRDAFYAMLVGNATPEQRGIFADNTVAGDGVALPVTTDTMIWDQVTTAHPILADVTVVKSGLVMKVTQGTPAAITGKKDKDASTEQTITFVDVTLAGVDYHTYVELSFAEAKMSAGAMESYLATEVADAIGESVAKAVFARILSDVGSAAATKSSSNTYFECVNTALGAATQATNAVIYAPASLYYAMQAECDANGQPILRDGVAFGRQVKIDNAATKITVVDPSAFILNVVQDVTIESSKDLKEAAYIIGGYMRAEGCLRKTKAASYVG